MLLLLFISGIAILLFSYGFVNFVMDYYQNVVLFCSCDVTRGACLLSLSTSLEVLVLVLDVLLVKWVDATWGAEGFCICIVSFVSIRCHLRCLFLIFLSFFTFVFALSFLRFDLCWLLSFMIGLIIVLVLCHLGQYNW